MLQINFSNIFTAQYLFELTPAYSANLTWILNIMLIALVASTGIYLFIKRAKFIAGVHKVIIRGWARVSVIILLVGILLIFFRSQGFRYLSMRILLLIDLLAFIINLIYWAARFVRKKVVRIAKASNEENPTVKYQDYLPKKRKK